MSSRTTNASPVSTGNKGVAFENGFGALVLAYLLAEKPLAFLAGLKPTRIQFQGAQLGPVDDFVIQGGGGRVTAFVAARMKPQIRPTDRDTVKLFTAFLEEYVKDPPAMINGTKVLVLACLRHQGHTDVLRELCEDACKYSDAFSFAKAVPEFNDKRLIRWNAFQELIAKASDEVPHSPTPWALLKALRVEPHIFAAGSQSVVEAMNHLTDYRTTHPATPNAAFDQLVSISHSTAYAGGSITRESLLELLTNQQIVGASPAIPDSINSARAVVPQAVTGLASWARFCQYDLQNSEDRTYLAKDIQQLDELSSVLADVYPDALDTLVVYLQQATWNAGDRAELPIFDLIHWRKGCARPEVFSHLGVLDQKHIIFLDEESQNVASNDKYASYLRRLAEFCEGTPVDLRSLITEKKWALLD